MWRICPLVTQHQRLNLLRIFMKFGAGNLYKIKRLMLCMEMAMFVANVFRNS